MSAPLPYGVRTRMAGMRAWSDARKTLAERRTPSRMATGTFRYFTMGFCAATAGLAQIARIRNSFRTEDPKIAYRFAPPDDGPRCARPPVGRLLRPPLPSMLAEPYGGAGSRVPTDPPRCARTHPRETGRTPARRSATPVC